MKIITFWGIKFRDVNFTNPLKKRNISKIEGDVKERHEVIDEFKNQELADSIAFELRFRTMIFYSRKYRHVESKYIELPSFPI